MSLVPEDPLYLLIFYNILWLLLKGEKFVRSWIITTNLNWCTQKAEGHV